MRRGSVDPGKHACAFAVSEGDAIVWVEYGRDFDTVIWYLDELYLEVPKVYPGVRAEDPNDIVAVARGLGYAEAQLIEYGKKIEIAPRDWKGTIAKEKMTKRIETLLRPGELALVDALKLPKKTRHNVLDAAGILLWALGRLEY